MKWQLAIVLAACTIMVATKNVFNPAALPDLKEDDYVDKRDADAKNTPNLQDLSDSVANDIQKRKNTPNLQDLAKAVGSDNDIQKRKNVVNLADFKVEPNDKREAKNTFDIAAFLKQHLHVKRGENQQVLSNPDTEDSQSDENLLFTLDSADCYNNLLQSILPQLKSISIFAGYIRNNQDLDSKTELADQNMLIIAPTDDAIENKLSGLKPWEFPHSLDDAKNDREQDAIIDKNIQNFLFGHIVSDFEKKLVIETDSNDQTTKIIATTLNNGKNLQIKQDPLSEKFFIRIVDDRDANAISNNWIPVQTVRQVENGFIFVIENSLVKP